MSLFYKLDNDKNVVTCSAAEWQDELKKMIDEDTRHVAYEIIDNYLISTVWLGIDHSFGIKDLPPLLFETMIHNEATGEFLNYQVRYPTWKEAEEGHELAVQWVKDGCKDELNEI